MVALKILVICDSLIALDTYETLFSTYGELFSKHATSKDVLLDINTSLYNIILIDVGVQSYIQNIKKMKNIAEKRTSRIILLSPFSAQQLKESADTLQYIDFVLTKPFELKKLLGYIDNELERLKKALLLETKNYILVHVLDLNPMRIGVYQSDGLLFWANERYLSANHLTAQSIDTIKFDAISQCNLGFDFITSKLGRNRSFTLQKEEDKKWYESTFYKAKEEYIIHICNDISAAKSREMELEQSAVFFESSSEGIVITNKKAEIVSVNKAFSKITGYTKEEVMGKNPRILKSGMHDKNFYENMYAHLENNGFFKGEVWNKRKNGEIYPEWLSISKIKNKKYNEIFYIAIFSDITSLKENDKKIYFYANHDPLTGLPNRFQFESQLANAIEGAKRAKTKVGVLFIDLDKFKEVNDTYGHNIGDVMLQSVSKRLSSAIRGEDILARIGGDEFVIIAKDVKESADMLILAKKLQKTMSEPILIESKSFFMSLSIGIALYPDHGKKAEEIIKNADVAMYEVKEGGRDGFVLFSQEMSQKISNQVTIQSELRDAIKNDEFVMYYQSVIDFKTSKLIGAEALVRWQHPTKGIVPPLAFLDYLSQTRLEREFNALVVQKVLKDTALLNAKMGTTKIKVAINIAPTQFFEPQFAKKMKTLCEDYNIEPSQIELELLENQVMKNVQIAQIIFNELHSYGFKISLDDFGTGHSSLNYLKKFQVDKLKIDQSFVRDMLEDESDDAIVKAVINLAKIFKMSVQAEGVETQEHFSKLAEYGCDASQGYLHAKPVPLETFIETYHG